MGKRLLKIDPLDPVIPKLARQERWHSTLTRMLKKGWIYLESGRHRAGYARGNIVIKIPINDYGLSDNDSEASYYRRYKNKPDGLGIRFARCRLLKNGWLMMVRVRGLQEQPRPDWADWVDCGQIGKTVSGKVVAYDYGNPGR